MKKKEKEPQTAAQFQRRRNRLLKEEKEVERYIDILKKIAFEAATAVYWYDRKQEFKKTIKEIETLLKKIK